ncbi:hypothetical protein A4X13_0g5314 [Tilletia indica]|uniref:Uncharacterized protein n=1 Tax=Tilletia indica TaxID=43049 RepID=A0A177T8Q2_9BASI|nr:hypothetical protein A4X13_0g5314 [Tilletia indica]
MGETCLQNRNRLPSLTKAHFQLGVAFLVLPANNACHMRHEAGLHIIIVVLRTGIASAHALRAQRSHSPLRYQFVHNCSELQSRGQVPLPVSRVWVGLSGNPTRRTLAEADVVPSVLGDAPAHIQILHRLGSGRHRRDPEGLFTRKPFPRFALLRPALSRFVSLLRVIQTL